VYADNSLTLCFADFRGSLTMPAASSGLQPPAALQEPVARGAERDVDSEQQQRAEQDGRISLAKEAVSGQRSSRLPGPSRDIIAQRLVDARLIAAALGLRLEPVHHVGVEAQGELLLDRAIELAALGVRPVELFGNVGKIDILVPHGGEFSKLFALRVGQRRRIGGIELITDQLIAHNISVPPASRALLR